MNKLLLVSMLVLLCIANVNATRFLDETVKPAETEGAKDAVIPTPTEVNPTPAEKTPVPEEKTPITEEKPAEKATEQQNEQKEPEVVVVPPTKEQEDTKTEETDKKDVPAVVVDETIKEQPKEESKEVKEGEEQKPEEKEEEPAINPIKEEDKKSSYFGLSFGFILFLCAGVLFFFVGFYRYSLRKYKIPPFTPPTFCPNFLFPRPENDLLMEDYCIQSGTEMGGVYSSEKYHNFY